jgi:hypothetical protein
MDYVSGIDEILMSARIKNAPLSYDKMAMDWAYSDDDKALNESVSRYCTDDDIALANSQGLQIYGCERFDAGNNPFLRKYQDARSEKENFVKVLFASIIGRTYPGDQPEVVNNIENVLRDTMKWGQLNLEPLKFVNQVMMDVTKNAAPAPSFASLEYVKSGQIHYSKFGMDEALLKERSRSVAEAGGYAAVLNGLLRNPDGSISLNWLERQVEDLEKSAYLAKGKTLAGREYELTPEQQGKVLMFFKSLVALNKKTLMEGVAALLPKVEEATKEQNGSAAVVSALLPKDLLSEGDAALLADLYLELTAANAVMETVKVGPGLAKEVRVIKSSLSAVERTEWAKLLSSKGLRFNMDLKRALVRKTQYDRVNSFLKEVSAELDLSVVKKPGDLPGQLFQEGLVDKAASAWLSTEVAVLLALDKI